MDRKGRCPVIDPVFRGDGLHKGRNSQIIAAVPDKGHAPFPVLLQVAPEDCLLDMPFMRLHGLPVIIAVHKQVSMRFSKHCFAFFT